MLPARLPAVKNFFQVLGSFFRKAFVFRFNFPGNYFPFARCGPRSPQARNTYNTRKVLVAQ